ncbi:hypothetical protein ElyMa_002742500 [Elysia marginata]|uniref:Uncharacterized protein n=1 Tax=Elysia marginata TaxID=1093978 RepID=A0AAV4HHJ8_9GAST|nr:hypothetical protein ElyMa_002742500 [Elysia marginata]
MSAVNEYYPLLNFQNIDILTYEFVGAVAAVLVLVVVALVIMLVMTLLESFGSVYGCDLARGDVGEGVDKKKEKVKLGYEGGTFVSAIRNSITVIINLSTWNLFLTTVPGRPGPCSQVHVSDRKIPGFVSLDTPSEGQGTSTF